MIGTNIKVKLIFIYNMVFYVFIIVHSYYLDDYLPQVLFYMFLAFSSFLLEETFKKNINKLKGYSIIDFLLRVAVIIIHFVGIYSKSSTNKINLIIALFFITNIIMELIITSILKNENISNNENETETERINQQDINKFIVDFKHGKINSIIIGTELKEEINKAIKTIKISGESTIVIISTLVSIFILRIFYEHFFGLSIIVLLIILFLLYLLYKTSKQLVYGIIKEKEKRRKKIFIDMITFVIGYLILLGHHVILGGKMVDYTIMMDVIGVMLFMPIYKTKLLAKKRLEEIYIKYNKNISS